MQRSTDRIRTTHVGSLPRSDRLTRLMYDNQEGHADQDELWKVIAEEVNQTVLRQRDVGIDVPSDGEAGKAGFSNYVRSRLGGLAGNCDGWKFYDLVEMPKLQDDQFGSEAAAHINMPACEGELSYDDTEVQRDISNMRKALGAAGLREGFLPVASPGILTFQVTNRHYETYEDYLQAMSEVMREEYEAIASSGLLVQVDAPDLPCAAPEHSDMCPPEIMEKYGFAGVVNMHLEAIENATRNIPTEQFRLHLCWGNYEASHHYDKPLKDIIEPVLNRTRAGAVLFEAANPRHEHEWEIFEQLRFPDDKILIPGVIDTLTNFVEHSRAVHHRILRWANVIDKEQLMVGTDCGFGTFVGFGEVLGELAWEKLESLAEGAALASESLFGEKTTATSV
jgi:5-methyltetrahydropteroyltriglutamate--homocysteine methyltransferase